jgi:hypothetical protein
MFIAFLTFLFTALAEFTTYRAVLALAAGAFLVLSIVQLVRSSRERRRLRQSGSTVVQDAPEHGDEGTKRPGENRPGHGPDRNGPDRNQPDQNQHGDDPSAG